ncbi:unnamed protein product [Coregonus sp. 'balchen']|nr:unnamed protein product [Coregonus sp. 'balchen']
MATCMLSSKMSPIIRFVLKEQYYSSRPIYNGVTEISRRGYSTDGDALPQPAAEDRNAAAAYSGLLEHYTSLVRDGALREDPHQKDVVQTWDQMHKTLRGYRNQPTSIFSKSNAGRMAKAYDPMAPLAGEISEEACLLCFDEFQNGIQRVNFVPFIAVLKNYCQELRLDSGIDYRRRNRPSDGKLYFL